ncbi:MAG TPA: hypothetical protein VGM83_02185 [Devosiaceae bacterium]|jgi:hypothetical protein
MTFREMTLRPLLVLALLAATTPAFADDIACTGPLGPDSSEAQLIATFGKDNVVTAEVDGPEGSTLLTTTVFPNDPDKTFRVGWWDEPNRKFLNYFTVPARDTAPGGLRVGQTIAEVEQLNGGPFYLYGFYWDYGGIATFENGPLSKLPGDCFVNLTFNPTRELPPDVDPDPVSGDKQIASTEPLLERLAPTVSEVMISFGDPNARNTD